VRIRAAPERGLSGCDDSGRGAPPAASREYVKSIMNASCRLHYVGYSELVVPCNVEHSVNRMGWISLHARRIVTAAAIAGALVVAPAASAAAAASSAAVAARSANSGTSRVRQVPPQRLSQGQRLGLRATPDPLALRSSVALVIDQDTGEVIFSKNETAVLPIASITKLMTALIVTEAEQPLDQVLAITQADVDTLKGTTSRLRVGARLSRGELLHLALMSSENRAAHALGRNYPGGVPAFVTAMNRKARELGMTDTQFADPTGLSSVNQSSARDLAVLVQASSANDLIRLLSTSPAHHVAVGKHDLYYRNSNRLVFSPQWSISLQKTGFIREAGRCVVMQAQLADRHLILVLLDATGPETRIADAERLRRWITGDDTPATFLPPAI
jgi:serine-type D-Ala-D-Ala endopeptidase (penicillin-binding protein 7)